MLLTLKFRLKTGRTNSVAEFRVGASNEPNKWWPRLFWGFGALAAASVLYTALNLTPDLSGVGTHTQLGLAPCGVLTMTGYPCPGCGLTTSFAHLMHGNVLEAIAANPTGVMLCLLTCLALPLLLAACFRAAPVVVTLERFYIDRLTIFVALAAIITWIGKLLGTMY